MSINCLELTVFVKRYQPPAYLKPRPVQVNLFQVVNPIAGLLEMLIRSC